MLTGMGLALGIDYSLFVVSRYREERGGGRAELDAIAAAGATASRAVLFSGSVVRDRADRNAARALERDEEPRRRRDQRRHRLGARRADAAAGAARAARRPRQLRCACRSSAGTSAAAAGGALLGRRRPGRACGDPVAQPASSSTALLVALAVPALGLQRSAPAASARCRTGSSRSTASTRSQRDFPQASSNPALIAVVGRSAARPARDCEAARASSARDPDFGPQRPALLPPTAVSPRSGRSSRGDKPGRGRSAPSGSCARRVIPQAFAGAGARVLVGGETAENVDYFDADEPLAADRLRLRARPELRPADGRLPLDRHRRRRRSSSTCSRSAPPTGS